MGHARKLGIAAAKGLRSLAVTAAPAAAEAVTVRTLHFATIVGPNGDVKCDVVGDL